MAGDTLCLGDTLYLGEHKRVLGEDGILDLQRMIASVRWAGGFGQQASSAQTCQSRARQGAALACMQQLSCQPERCCCCPRRAVLTRSKSPALAAALQGVTHAKLFLAGQTVQADLPVDELASIAETASVSVVLPSGQALGVVHAAPAVRL